MSGSCPSAKSTASSQSPGSRKPVTKHCLTMSAKRASFPPNVNRTTSTLASTASTCGRSRRSQVSAKVPSMRTHRSSSGYSAAGHPPMPNGRVTDPIRRSDVTSAMTPPEQARLTYVTAKLPPSVSTNCSPQFVGLR